MFSYEIKKVYSEHDNERVNVLLKMTRDWRVMILPSRRDRITAITSCCIISMLISPFSRHRRGFPHRIVHCKWRKRSSVHKHANQRRGKWGRTTSDSVEPRRRRKRLGSTYRRWMRRKIAGADAWRRTNGRSSPGNTWWWGWCAIWLCLVTEAQLEREREQSNFLFSRVHATLQPALSFCPSVRQT